MLNKSLNFLDKNYIDFKELSIGGRHVILDDIVPILQNLPKMFHVQKLGESTNKLDIYKIRFGNGKIKILCWSQMHGNESTGTNAMFDLFQFFKNPLELKELRDFILERCTFIFIPILNPDGAKKYTRLNAQKIDLNRDAIDLKAIESQLLRSALDSFKPDYCFNLHNQRTIFSVGKENNPATLSFLAPSVNEKRELTTGRKQTMKVIASMYESLHKLIPNQIGRYTDQFYPTATGDNFQKEGYNTILIEAGHFKNDYKREITRKYNFIALLCGINQIATNNTIDYNLYFEIPNNKKEYLDIIYENVWLKNKKYSFGVVYEEQLVEDKILFIPICKETDPNINYNTNKRVSKRLEFKTKMEFETYLLKQEQFII